MGESASAQGDEAQAGERDEANPSQERVGFVAGLMAPLEEPPPPLPPQLPPKPDPEPVLRTAPAGDGGAASRSRRRGRYEGNPFAGGGMRPGRAVARFPWKRLAAGHEPARGRRARHGLRRRALNEASPAAAAAAARRRRRRSSVAAAGASPGGAASAGAARLWNPAKSSSAAGAPWNAAKPSSAVAEVVEAPAVSNAPKSSSPPKFKSNRSATGAAGSGSAPATVSSPGRTSSS